MKSTYELKSRAREGSLKLTYEDALLIGFEIAFKPALSQDKYEKLLTNIPVLESCISKMEFIGLEIITAPPANEKLALFCRMYEKHKGIKYKVSAPDSGKIKTINPTEEQLQAYFKSENFLFKGKQSIANLVKYWNEFRADLAGHGKSKFPDEWQPDLIKKLSPQETIHYYSHLRSLGLNAVKTPGGQVVGFK